SRGISGPNQTATDERKPNHPFILIKEKQHMQVIVGGQAEFNGLVYGDKHPGTTRFLQNQLNMGFSDTLSDFGKQMFSSIHSLYEKFNGENALRLAKAARRKVTGLFQQDVIKPLWTVEEIQQATLSMQR